MNDLTFRRAEWNELDRIKAFINDNFDMRLPLINRADFFSFYYCADRLPQFVLAEQDGELIALAGYILANRSSKPDVWVSVWVAKKGHNGAGLELMNALPGVLNARVVACNNIRANTCGMYRFLGWKAERLPHYYRLAHRAEYRLAQPAEDMILPVGGSLTLDRVSSVTRLRGLGMPPLPTLPAKDLWYMARRYFCYPQQHYDVFSVSQDGFMLAYLVTRTVSDATTGSVPVLRIVDFVGASLLLPQLGSALDRLLDESGAEYADCYCAGIPAEIWAQAGFCERREGDGTIIPNYLDPPLRQNTEYYYFTNQPDCFTMFKADGDQDRPNLPAEN